MWWLQNMVCDKMCWFYFTTMYIKRHIDEGTVCNWTIRINVNKCNNHLVCVSVLNTLLCVCVRACVRVCVRVCVCVCVCGTAAEWSTNDWSTAHPSWTKTSGRNVHLPATVSHYKIRWRKILRECYTTFRADYNTVIWLQYWCIDSVQRSFTECLHDKTHVAVVNDCLACNFGV